MTDDYVNEITTLLNDEDAFNPRIQSQLAKLVYLDLKRIGFNRLANESLDNSLTITGLVHETFIRLNECESMTWKNRRHYYGAAAEAMRRILIDRARYHFADRREGEKMAIPLEEGLLLEAVKPRHLIELSDALTDLEAHDKELAELVKLRYFVGLSLKEIAEMQDVSSRTIDRRWSIARAWLMTEIGQT